MAVDATVDGGGCGVITMTVLCETLLLGLLGLCECPEDQTLLREVTWFIPVHLSHIFMAGGTAKPPQRERTTR